MHVIPHEQREWKPNSLSSMGQETCLDNDGATIFSAHKGKIAEDHGVLLAPYNKKVGGEVYVRCYFCLSQAHTQEVHYFTTFLPDLYRLQTGE